MISSFIAWLTVGVLGASIAQNIVPRTGAMLKLGLSFPLGMGTVSVFMFVFNLVGIPVDNSFLLIGTNILLTGISGWFLHRRSLLPQMDKSQFQLDLNQFSRDPGFYLLIFLIAIIVVAITVKGLFWPIANYDSVAGYDLIGKIIAFEGTIDNTVFEEANNLQSNRTGYPPFYPYTLAFGHITGSLSPKISSPLFFISLALTFYSLLRYYLKPFASALFTLLLISAPDLADFHSISSNNPPLAYYSGIGLLAVYIWYDKGIREFLWLGTVLLALGNWDRNEAIFFAFAAGLLVLHRSYKNKQWKDPLIFGAAVLAPFIIWQWYIRTILHGLITVEVRYYLFWDPERVDVMLKQISDTTFSSHYWGIAIIASLVILAINVPYTIFRRKRDAWALVLCIVVAWILYVLLFYQMEADFVSVGWLLHSYKRGLYTYLPPLIFAAAIAQLSLFVFNREAEKSI